MRTETVKICTSCNKEKELSHFFIDKRWDIPRSKCKECCAEYNRKRPPAKRNPVTANAATKRWEEKNSEKVKAYRAQYEKDHAEIRNARRRKDGIHYERVVSYVHTRRALLQGCEGTHTAEEWEALKTFYNNICLRCGEEKPLVRDHVIPLSLGGSNMIENIQPLCRSCNAKKATKIIDYRGTTDKCEIKF